MGVLEKIKKLLGIKTDAEIEAEKKLQKELDEMTVDEAAYILANMEVNFEPPSPKERRAAQILKENGFYSGGKNG